MATKKRKKAKNKKAKTKKKIRINWSEDLLKKIKSLKRPKIRRALLKKSSQNQIKKKT